MTSLLRGALRGMGSGAAGTAALNLTTYADMAVRGRPASHVPEALVATAARRLGTEVPGRGSDRANRLQGIGAVAGTVNGMLVGALGGTLRAAGIRLPTVLGGPLLGAAAMAASDVPIALLGLSNPRRWTRQDWIADSVPHLVFGIVAHAGIVATARADEQAEIRLRGAADRTRRPTTGDLLRAASLGAASGARSTAGMTALAVSSRSSDPGTSGRLSGGGTRTLHVLAALGEAGADKHPAIPSRTSAAGLAPRLLLGGTSAGSVTSRHGRESGPSFLVGATAAAGTAIAGTRARSAAAHRLGTDLPGAVAEDVLAALLAWAGTRRPRPRR